MLFAGGFGAGFINSMAGGGSVLTVPVLNEAVGATIANGTNRVAILLANLAGTFAYHKGGKVPWRRVGRFLPGTLAGAVAGSWLATRVPTDWMREIFAVVIFLVAATVVVRPRRWLEEGPPRLSPFWLTVVFFLIGAYGGFVQVGVGFLLLAGLVLGGGLELIKANGVKVVIIAAYTALALPVFLLAGQVDLLLGLVMAAGNVSGAYTGARLAVEKGAGWARWVLVTAAVGAAIRMAFF